jgi:RNA polymerase sigma-70 factor (ECF subfamily)
MISRPEGPRFVARCENRRDILSSAVGGKGEPSLSGALEEARKGDVSALWRASDDVRPYLRAVAAGILRGRLAGKVDVSDVVQQGMLAGVERFDQFRGTTRGEWQKWLVVIVRNEARNLLRYWHQERRHVAREDAVAGSRAVKASDDDDKPAPRLPASAPTASKQIAMREDASRMLEGLAALPADQQEVLTLRHFDGLSHAEIAERLGKSEAAVRQLWVRALKRLREAMS